MTAPGGKKIDAIIVSASDNVATCLNDIAAGADAAIMLGRDILSVRAGEAVPRGHKLAVKAIARGDAITKYGEVIGKASADIAKGRHVHVHNVID